MVSIIGAGPIGSYLGYLLSEKGIDNVLIEEHRKIGSPEQCTGLVSNNIDDIIPISWVRKAVLNKVKGAVISCGKENFEVRAENNKAYVFDRSLFDQNLAEKALNKGSRLLLSARYVGHKNSEKGIKIRLKQGSEESLIKDSHLVGADGPLSSVAKNSGLYGLRRFWTTSQVILRAKNPFFDKDTVYVHLDKRYSDGFFSWIVPIDESRAKVGLGSFSKPAEYMNRFLKNKFDNFVIESRQGGLIPVYSKIPVQNSVKNIFLAGDAALHVKATSGGGIVTGMLAAKELSRALNSENDYEKSIGSVRRNLGMHLMLRNRLNRMPEEKKQAMLRDLNDSSIKQALKEKGDMDFVSNFFFRVLARKPWLVRYLF